MQTRTVIYTPHDVRDSVSNATFQLIEAKSEGGIQHAVAIARTWRSIDASVEDNPSAPSLDSLHIEDAALGPDSGVRVCGHLDRARYDNAREVAEALAAREGFVVYRWNDEDDEAGGARAMAGSDSHTMALRVLPYDDRWTSVSGIVPKSRLAAIGGALQAAVVTLKLYPSWALEHGDQA